MEQKILSDFVKKVEAKGLTIQVTQHGNVVLGKSLTDQTFDLADVTEMQRLNKKGDLSRFLADIGQVQQ